MNAKEMADRLDAALDRHRIRNGLDRLDRRMAKQAEARAFRAEAAELQDVASRLDLALHRVQSPRRSAVEVASERWATRRAGVVPVGGDPTPEVKAGESISVPASVEPGEILDASCDPSIPVGATILVNVAGRSLPMAEHAGGGVLVARRDGMYLDRVVRSPRE